MKNINWIKDLKKNVRIFLDILAEDDFNYIKYSLSGDIYERSTNWGLGQNVFMVKILYMLGLLEGVGSDKRYNLINSIKKFQDDSGYISDSLIIKLITKKRFLFLKNKSNEFEVEKIRCAETRQSFSALNCLGEKPDRPFLRIPYNEKDIDTFLSGFNWEHPWDAGSHFSHLLFFLKLNKIMFEYKSDESSNLINYANKWVDNLQSEEDGFWYKGNTTIKEKINGAMKILTGKAAAGILDINNHEAVINGCLMAVNNEEACSNFNIIYCLYYCSNISDYRKKDIEDFCYNRLGMYKEFYFEDIGGFSFHKNKANDVYYGALITGGLNEPDIHGTVLFIWGIALISKILKLDLVNFKIPLT